MDTVQNRKPEDRVFTREFALDFFIEGCDELLAEDDMPQDKRELVEERKRELISLTYPDIIK